MLLLPQMLRFLDTCSVVRQDIVSLFQTPTPLRLLCLCSVRVFTGLIHQYYQFFQVFNFYKCFKHYIIFHLVFISNILNMFNCVQCPSVFAAKRNLVAHQKTHTDMRFSCNVCEKSFSYKTSLNKHLKNVHGIANVPVHLRPMPAAPVIAQPAQQIQIAPQVFVPDVPAGGSSMLSEDDMCMKAMNDFEDTG
ncbi:uncharacterized protein LOC132936909 [Metopolophium dirhodum]|uniref:uncharacterized protein LOC132936909 n=1 Tax=Metopolophium dirhodum TaxID=44670 RepID=UPI00298FDD17|nr:uncharacterized protein LOC132936909 [Metopolophium dirhodum]